MAILPESLIFRKVFRSSEKANLPKNKNIVFEICPRFIHDRCDGNKVEDLVQEWRLDGD